MPVPVTVTADLGIRLHSYVPGVIGLNVTNGFTVSGGNGGQGGVSPG